MHRSAAWVGAWVVAATMGLGCGPADGGQDLGGSHDPSQQTADPPCDAPLKGEAAFGAVLAAAADFALEAGGSERAISQVEVYFPEGRRPGAPVLLSGPASHWGDLAIERGFLGEDLGADVTWSGLVGLEALSVDGRLVGPDQGLQARLWRNFAAPESDVVVAGEAEARLCPVGPPPPPTLTWGDCVGPTSPLRLQGSAPIDPGSVVVTVTGGEVAVALGQDGALYAAPQPAFAPGRALPVSVSAHDVVGRPFEVRGAPRWLQTEDVLSDLSLTTPPPAQAADACGALSHDVAGRLVVEADRGARSAVLLLALPKAGAATQLQVHLGWEGCLAAEVAAVGADGSVTRLGFGGSDGEQTPTLALPAGRPLWLVLRVSHQRPEPQWGVLPACRGWVEDLRFE